MKRIRIRRGEIAKPRIAEKEEAQIAPYTFLYPYRFSALDVGDLFHVTSSLAVSGDIPKVVYRKESDNTCVCITGHDPSRKRHILPTKAVYKYEGPIS